MPKLPQKKQQKSLKRYLYLDSLRGIAILLVLIAHTNIYNSNILPGWFTAITYLDVAPRGVQLFYLVSAFTLCLSFSKRSLLEKHPLRNFYIRRFFRIAPLFYAALVYYLLQAYIFSHQSYSLANVLTTVTFTNGFFPLWMNNIVIGGWSVAVETTFYVFFPFLFQRIKHVRFALIATLLSMIVMQVFRLYLLGLPTIKNTPDFQTYTFEFFPSQLPIFFTGITLFLFLHSKFGKREKQFFTWFVPLLVALFIVQVFSGIKIIAGHYIYAMIFAGLLFFLARFRFALFVNPVVAYLGKVSFSMYLCHIAVLYWLSRVNLLHFLPAYPIADFFIRFVVLASIATAVASVLYILIEKPGIALGKKVIDHYERQQTASV